MTKDFRVSTYTGTNIDNVDNSVNAFLKDNGVTVYSYNVTTAVINDEFHYIGTLVYYFEVKE